MNIFRVSVRRFALDCGGESSEAVGLLLGLYNEDADQYGQVLTYTKTAEAFNKHTDGKLTEQIKVAGPVPKKGEVRVFYGLDKRFSTVAVVGLGDECVSYSDTEQMDEWKEAIREGAATGCRALQDLYIRTIHVDGMGHAESSAEGASMGVWVFQELKNEKHQKGIPRLELYGDCDYTGWQIGLQKAAAQNLARQLCETPANLMTPIAFAQSAVEVLTRAGVNVEVKTKNWTRMKQMDAFNASAAGSCEPPIFLEISYYGCEGDVSPAVLVGKGVTFDSGGLALGKCSGLKHKRGDMAGAACVVAACRACSALQLPINVRALVPLFENLPGTCALKPGDVIKANNGKTILVHSTDFDGRLALADALSYSTTFNPRFIMDVGTLVPAMVDMFGSAATGVFTNNDSLYDLLRIASIHTGDRVWRMPLWHHFTEKITNTPGVDIGDRQAALGVPCTAAGFLREFVPPCDWIHLDTYGVQRTDGRSIPYLRRGMSGRPTRTIVEFLAQLACVPREQSEKEKPAA
jgi:aminopeptidase